MKGEAKKIIDAILLERANGDPLLMSTTRTKLILKGFNPNRFTEDTDDNPEVIIKLRKIAVEFQVSL